MRILFVCLGNICRSPMAEFILKDLVAKRGRSHDFFIASAGTSDEEEGNPVYPPVKRLLQRNGMDCSTKRARKIVRSDYAEYDLIVGMETRNVETMRRFFGGDPNGKLLRLLDETDQPHDVADPWYTRDFDLTYREIRLGCLSLLNRLSTDADFDGKSTPQR